MPESISLGRQFYSTLYHLFRENKVSVRIFVLLDELLEVFFPFFLTSPRSDGALRLVHFNSGAQYIPKRRHLPTVFLQVNDASFGTSSCTQVAACSLQGLLFCLFLSFCSPLCSKARLYLSKLVTSRKGLLWTQTAEGRELPRRPAEGSAGAQSL